MRRGRRAPFAIGLLAAGLHVTAPGHAADGGSRAAAAESSGANRSDASAASAGATSERDGADAKDAAGAHGARAKGGAAGHDAMLPQDEVKESRDIPGGTIEAQVLTPGEEPLSNTDVTLGILHTSVAKGESRERVSARTDAAGKAKFSGLEVGSGVAYRITVSKDGALFSLPPFQMPSAEGMRAVLHIYPVERDIERTMVASQNMVFAEVKDDRVQVQQAFKIYNLGATAWVPNDLVIPLPSEFTAFATQQGMSDVAVEAVPGRGVRLKGTFSPGQHVVEFRWQIPYTGTSEVALDIGMPPHLWTARVITPASRGMGLDVEGFPSTQTSNDGVGQRALFTEKQFRRDDAPPRTVRAVIRGLPAEGPAKVIATLLAGSGVAIGIVLGARREGKSRRDPKERRRVLLAEIESLERSRAQGEVGPQTYERARRQLLDDLARTFSTPASGRPPKA